MTSRLTSLPTSRDSSPPGGGLQIGDGGDGEQFSRRQLWRPSVPGAIVQRANGVGVAGLGAQLPAAGDLDEFIGPRAQFVANVG